MKKILIVDDEKISLMMANHILSTAYDTVCATSGEEALEVFKREQPDLVLSDLRGPGLSGFKLKAKIQEMFHTQVPFMFMTSDTNEETESEGFANGAVDFVHKPFRVDALLQRTAKILNTVDEIQGLKKAAVMDPMTGLLNKASSQSEIARLCRTTRGVLMMIDLDSFKLVNDIYGHDMGDKILLQFSEILRAVVRPVDVVGRMGGDEFIAFCQHVEEEVVIEKKVRFINKYILEFAYEQMGKDMNIPLGASVGCVFVPQEGTDFESLYKKADKALYAVKKNGKHGFNFYKDESSQKVTEVVAESDIANTIKILSERNKTRGALALPLEQFRTVYQFLARLNENYQRKISILLFSIKETERSAIPIEEVAEQFQNVLQSTLRQSDVIGQTSKSQFTVLLPETEGSNISVVTSRIMENWSKEDASAMFTITTASAKMD